MKKLFGIISVMVIAIIFLITPCFASLVTIDLNSGISYQDDGTTLTYDDTTKLKSLDGNWGPTKIGAVINDYYATGGSDRWFDGISANFDLSSVNYSNITSATLWAYIKTGTYSSTWHHYKLYPGAMNATDEDSNPLGYAFDYNGYSNGGWISQDIPLSWINSNNLDVSLRLWNASADQVKLVTNVVPEPVTSALLGLGFLGFGIVRRKRKNRVDLLT